MEEMLNKNPLFFSYLSGWVFMILIQSICILYNKFIFKNKFALILINPLNTIQIESLKVINKFSENYQPIIVPQIQVPAFGDKFCPTVLCKIFNKSMDQLIKPVELSTTIENPFIFINPKIINVISKKDFFFLEAHPKINNLIIDNAIIIINPEIVDEASISELVMKETLILIDPQIIYEPIIYIAVYNETDSILSWIWSIFF